MKPRVVCARLCVCVCAVCVWSCVVCLRGRPRVMCCDVAVCGVESSVCGVEMCRLRVFSVESGKVECGVVRVRRERRRVISCNCTYFTTGTS